jgi:hypothetical protein
MPDNQDEKSFQTRFGGEGEARSEVPASQRLTTKLSRKPGSSCNRDRPAPWMDLLTEGIRPLPGRHVTDHQMWLDITFRQADGPAVAATKASIGDLLQALKYHSVAQDHPMNPAISAGVTMKLWELSDTVKVLEYCEAA